MADIAEQLADKAAALRKKGALEEALVAARASVDANGDCIQGWYQVALASEELKKTQAALAAYKRVLKLNDQFSYGWGRYGKLLNELGQDEEAKDAFESALSIDETDQNALLGLMTIYDYGGDSEEKAKHFKVLEKYHDHYGLSTSTNRIRLGNFYLDKKNYYKAIDCYQLCLDDEDYEPARFNMSIAYSQLHEHLTALDLLAETKRQLPTDEAAIRAYGRSLNILHEIRKSLNADDKKLITENDAYQIYLNPFQLLDITDTKNLEDIDQKEILRAKRDLLQEIDLEDGMVSWMDKQVFDKSRAIGCIDSLNNEATKHFHWLVLQDAHLLRFLSAGSIDYFLKEPDETLLVIEQCFRNDQDFAEWLSPYFASQFDKVLTQSLLQKKFNPTLALLGGRRLVTPMLLDACFEKAHAEVLKMLEPLKKVDESSEKIKPDIRRLENLLDETGIRKVLLRLPLQFRDIQKEVPAVLRSIAINCNNVHGDAELSKAILDLALELTDQTSALAFKLKEDEAQIANLIAKEKEKESHLTFSKTELSVTKTGVKYGGTFIKPDEVASLRWGTLINSTSDGKRYEFLMVIAGSGKNVRIAWTSVSDIEEQEKHFQKLVSAVLDFIFPALLERINRTLSAGGVETVGPCRLYRDHVEFETKSWFSTKVHALTWNNVKSNIKNGDLTIYNISKMTEKIEMSLRDTDNALVLHILANKQ